MARALLDGLGLDLKPAGAISGTPTINFPDIKSFTDIRIKNTGNEPFVVCAYRVAYIRQAGTVQILSHRYNEGEFVVTAGHRKNTATFPGPTPLPESAFS